MQRALVQRPASELSRIPRPTRSQAVGIDLGAASRAWRFARWGPAAFEPFAATAYAQFHPCSVRTRHLRRLLGTTVLRGGVDTARVITFLHLMFGPFAARCQVWQLLAVASDSERGIPASAAPATARADFPAGVRICAAIRGTYTLLEPRSAGVESGPLREPSGAACAGTTAITRLDPHLGACDRGAQCADCAAIDSRRLVSVRLATVVGDDSNEWIEWAD